MSEEKSEVKAEDVPVLADKLDSVRKHGRILPGMRSRSPIPEKVQLITRRSQQAMSPGPPRFDMVYNHVQQRITHMLYVHERAKNKDYELDAAKEVINDFLTEDLINSVAQEVGFSIPNELSNAQWMRWLAEDGRREKEEDGTGGPMMRQLLERLYTMVLEAAS